MMGPDRTAERKRPEKSPTVRCPLCDRLHRAELQGQKAGPGRGRGMRVMKTSYIPTVVVVKQLYTFVTIHHIVHLKSARFLVWKLYLMT